MQILCVSEMPFKKKGAGGKRIGAGRQGLGADGHAMNKNELKKYNRSNKAKHRGNEAVEEDPPVAETLVQVFDTMYKEIFLYEKSTFILNLSYRALFFSCIKSFILIQGNDDELNALRLQMESLLKKKDEEIAFLRSSLREQPPQEGNSQQCCGGWGVPKRKSWDELETM